MLRGKEIKTAQGISIYYNPDEQAAYVEEQRNKDCPIFP
jgi:hypothetical protein